MAGRGVGFVNYRHHDDAVAAVHMLNGTCIGGGRKLQVALQVWLGCICYIDEAWHRVACLFCRPAYGVHVCFVHLSAHTPTVQQLYRIPGMIKLFRHKWHTCNATHLIGDSSLHSDAVSAPSRAQITIHQLDAVTVFCWCLHAGSSRGEGRSSCCCHHLLAVKLYGIG